MQKYSEENTVFYPRGKIMGIWMLLIKRNYYCFGRTFFIHLDFLLAILSEER